MIEQDDSSLRIAIIKSSLKHLLEQLEERINQLYSGSEKYSLSEIRNIKAEAERLHNRIKEEQENLDNLKKDFPEHFI